MTIKKLIVLLIAIVSINVIQAQVPQKINYQAIIRDNNNNLVIDKPVKVQLSILKGLEDDNASYIEIHKINTNDNGLVSLQIGGGEPVDSYIFSKVDWSTGSYFVKTEVDINNDGVYDITTSSQLLSVPYALHAKTTETIGALDFPQGYIGEHIYVYGEYVVPKGKTLYIVYDSSGTYGGVPYGQFGVYKEYMVLNNRSVSGILVDKDPKIEIVNYSSEKGDYVVPKGKKLVVRSFGYLREKKDDKYLYYRWMANGKVTYNGRLMVFPAGVKLSAQNKKRLGFTGYLINE